jgi:hypothetical protein
MGRGLVGGKESIDGLQQEVSAKDRSQLRPSVRTVGIRAIGARAHGAFLRSQAAGGRFVRALGRDVTRQDVIVASESGVTRSDLLTVADPTGRAR